METLSALLALCVGNLPVTDGFMNPLIKRQYVLFVVSLNKLLNQQLSCWWFEWRWHSCDIIVMIWSWKYSVSIMIIWRFFFLQNKHNGLPMACQWWGDTGPRFTDGSFLAIQIRWKFRFILTSALIQWWLQNFVHGTTAVLSWHVQKFVAIWWPVAEL